MDNGKSIAKKGDKKWPKKKGPSKMDQFVLDEEICLLRAKDSYEKHGMSMFMCWFFFGYGILFTKRYLKPFWFVTDIIHSVLGYLVCFFTFFTTYMLISMQGFDMDIHALFGYGMVILCIFMATSGSIILGYRCCCAEPKWNAKPKEWYKFPVFSARPTDKKVGKVHRILGYVSLALGSVTITLGGIDYAIKQRTN